MPKFYEHDVNQSREMSQKRSEAAAHITDSAERLGFMALMELKELSEIGLPDCYNSIQDYLFDFWPNLPWDEEGRIKAIGYVLNSKEFTEINKTIKEVWDFDFAAELKAGLEEEE